jgi:hypothetical protein
MSRRHLTGVWARGCASMLAILLASAAMAQDDLHDGSAHLRREILR